MFFSFSCHKQVQNVSKLNKAAGDGRIEHFPASPTAIKANMLVSFPLLFSAHSFISFTNNLHHYNTQELKISSPLSL